MQIYYVGVYLSERIHFGSYGFTNYADCVTETQSPEEARETAKRYFEMKYKVAVTKARAQIADKKFIDRDQLIKPIKNLNQQNLFNINSADHEQRNLFSKTNNRPERTNTLANICKRSTLYFNRLFGKHKGYNSTGF